jgi:ribosome-binding factor A
LARDYPRSRRIEEQIQRLLSEVIRQQLRDPRVHGAVITDVRVSRDLSVARVFYTALESDIDVDGMQQGLAHAAGFLRSCLARELTSRTVPELRFVHDELPEKSRRMDALIDDAVRDLGPAGDDEASGEPTA